MGTETEKATYTDRARHALASANMHAEKMGQGYIGTDHILLGLLADKSNVACQILLNLGVTPETAEAEVRKLFDLDDPEAKLKAQRDALLEACEAVLDSDMAMRAEDEGQKSPVLDKLRSAIAAARGGAG